MARILLVASALAGMLTACAPHATRVQICIDSEAAPVLHAARAIGAAAGENATGPVPCQGVDETGSAFVIRLAVDPSAQPEDQSFSIRRTDETRLEIVGADPAGALYGGLAVAEDLRNGLDPAAVPERTESPHVPFRAIKFNLPWDSYRHSPALDLHTETARDTVFWAAFLDMMAENRFNALTLWNLHPFIYLVRPVDFPEASPFSDEELAGWQTFFHTLFRMAKDRAIETYLVNWNIFVPPDFARAHGVALNNLTHEHYTDGDTSDIVKRYTRSVVSQVLQEYPDLTGLGLGLGEAMGGMTPVEREQWALETIVAGMQDAGRPVKLIHRVPFSANLSSGGSTDRSTEIMTRRAMEAIDGIEPPIWVEVKFNWSHAHSTPRLIKVHGGAISDTYWNPPPERYKIAWMMRNEDFFVLRWGVPDFIREHVARNTPEYVGGYFVGSECYIPAVDYFTRPERQGDWRYAFQRQWLFYKLWGRLLYDPDTPDSVFRADFVRRYGPPAAVLLEAYELAGRMPLRLASFQDLTWDFTLYSEGFIAKWGNQPPRFIDVDRLIANPPLDTTYLSIPDYVELELADADVPPGRIPPVSLADELELDAQRALDLVARLPIDGNVTLANEVADVQIWSALSRYFAKKLRGAIALQRYRRTGKMADQEESVLRLEEAVAEWDRLVELSAAWYRDMPLVHFLERDHEPFHWSRLRADVLRDVEIARAESSPGRP